MKQKFVGLKKLYIALIFLFMYAPIALMLVQSFNSSKSRGRWGGFTLQWYASLFTDEEADFCLETLLESSAFAL